MARADVRSLAQKRRNERGAAGYERDSVKRERQHDERGSGATREVAMQQERRRFNNQPVGERRWSNERQGNATTSQHKRGAVRHERRWHDEREASGKARGGTARGARQWQGVAQQWQGVAW